MGPAIFKSVATVVPLSFPRRPRVCPLLPRHPGPLFFVCRFLQVREANARAKRGRVGGARCVGVRWPSIPCLFGGFVWPPLAAPPPLAPCPVPTLPSFKARGLLSTFLLLRVCGCGDCEGEGGGGRTPRWKCPLVCGFSKSFWPHTCLTSPLSPPPSCTPPLSAPSTLQHEDCKEHVIAPWTGHEGPARWRAGEAGVVGSLNHGLADFGWPRNSLLLTSVPRCPNPPGPCTVQVPCPHLCTGSQGRPGRPLSRYALPLAHLGPCVCAPLGCATQAFSARRQRQGTALRRLCLGGTGLVAVTTVAVLPPPPPPWRRCPFWAPLRVGPAAVGCALPQHACSA